MKNNDTNTTYIPENLDDVWHTETGEAYTMRKFYEEIERITNSPQKKPASVKIPNKENENG